MQNKRILLSLIVASVVGLIALFVASIFVKDDEANKGSLVVAAAENIALGVPISAGQLKLIKLPKNATPGGTKDSIDALIGRVPKSNISSGEIILESMLYSPSSSAGLAFAISPGKRAIAMSVNEVSEVAGFVNPGSYVDILFSSKDDSGRFNSKIIMQRVLVLAVAQDRMGSDEAKPKVATSVTLEVTPQQAEILDAARLAGNVSLVLRNQTEGFGETSQSEVRTQTSNENGVEVIRGTSVRMESGLGR